MTARRSGSTAVSLQGLFAAGSVRCRVCSLSALDVKTWKLPERREQRACPGAKLVADPFQGANFAT